MHLAFPATPLPTTHLTTYHPEKWQPDYVMTLPASYVLPMPNAASGICHVHAPRYPVFNLAVRRMYVQHCQLDLHSEN